jgi:hypothetical protein
MLYPGLVNEEFLSDARQPAAAALQRISKIRHIHVT